MSTQTSDNNKRIAKNTLLLYIRMLFNLVVTLYTSRVILQALGVEDMGIYNVVGGIVSMSQVVTSSISNAISRYLTFELGKGNHDKLKKTFSISVSILVILSVIIFFVSVLGGEYFINNVLNISYNRIVAARYVLLFSTLTFCINMMSVPYNASIISHEKMDVFAYVGIFEVIMKLTVAYAIMMFPSVDKLILYSILLFGVGFIIRIFYGLYCGKFFHECHYSFIWDKKIIKEVLGFASWTFWGDLANIFKSQGVSMLVNVFFGVTINAAQAIANQVSNAIQQFSNNFMTAVTPHIIKLYAAGESKKMVDVANKASRFSFYITIVIVFPIICNLHDILHIWLKKVPDYTDSFIELIVLYILFDVLSQPVIRMINATGKVKRYQMGISLIMFANFPLSYITLKLGLGPNSIYFISAFTGCLALVYRIYIIDYLLPEFDAVSFCRKTMIQPLFIFIFAGIIIFLMVNLVPYKIVRFFASFFIGETILLVFIYLKGMSKSERSFVKTIILSKLRKYHKEQ